MPTVLPGNANEVIGGPANLLLAPSTYAMPSRISEVVSLSTYIGNTTYGFVSIGWTDTAINVSREVSEKAIHTSQQGLLKTLPIDYKSMISSSAVQTNQTNKVRLQQASVGAANGGSEAVTYFEAAPFLTVWRLAILFQDDLNKFHVKVFPHVQWDGKAQKELFDRATIDSVDFSFEAYPSSDALGPNGYNSDRIDFDQP